MAITSPARTFSFVKRLSSSYPKSLIISTSVVFKLMVSLPVLVAYTQNTRKNGYHQSILKHTLVRFRSICISVLQLAQSLLLCGHQCSAETLEVSAFDIDNENTSLAAVIAKGTSGPVGPKRLSHAYSFFP